MICLLCGDSNNLERNPPHINGRKTHAMCPGFIAKLNMNDKAGGIERVNCGKSMKRNFPSDDVDEEE